MTLTVNVVAPPDTTKPTVSTFTATTPSNSLNIPITAFTASDNVAVTGYLITESATPPAAGAAGWTGSAPATYTVAANGTYTLYPWAKDAAGNVSDAFATPRTVVVDATKPTVSAFTATTPSNSLNIPITAFTATDNVAVTGYLITESATPPAAGAAGWTGSAPASYTVAADGTYTLYPWAKDGAGNVSNVFGTPRTVVVDTTKPSVSSFTATTPTNSLNIPITAFTATDNTAVTGYLITESATPPAAGAAGWTGSAPATYTVAADGTYTLYPWAKDAAGNVSNVFGSPRTVVVDTTGPVDGTLTVTPGDTQNALSWSAASDTGSGLRTGTIYNVRYVTGLTPPADCASGTSIYTGDNLSYPHTGLINGTDYSYRVCAYDNVNNASAGATASGTPTAPPCTGPTVTTPTLTSGLSAVTAVDANLTGSQTAKGGTNVVERGFVWNTTGTPTTANNKVIAQSGANLANGNFSTLVGSLPNGTLVYARTYANNNGGACTGYSPGQLTFYTEPTAASGVTIDNISAASMRINWTNGSNTTALVLVKQAGAVDAWPVDASSYTANTAFASGSQIGTGNYVVFAGSGNTVTVTGLSASTQYFVAVIAYAGSGADSNYQQDTPATGNATTSAAGDTTPPTVTSTTPTNGATGVALNAQVTINFSENIDCTTVNTTTITINPNPGTWTRSSCSGSQAVFTPTGQANSTAYSVNVTTGVKDLAGNAMSAAYPFSYTTVAAGADAVAPKVISFLATTPVTTSVNIPVTVFSATDNVGVTGYMITASSTQPGAGDAGWAGTAPATFSAAAGDGTKTLYPWVKDAAGNVSAVFGAPASVVVDGTGPTDGTLTVTAGDTLNALSWTAANDGTGVGLRATSRYEVRFAAGATAPVDCAAGTSLYTGNNLTFTHSGLTNGSQYSYRVCAYDALNNISTGATGSGTPIAANTPTLSETAVKWTTSGKVSSAKTTTATLGATINAAGTSAITARGIVWSTTNTNPTIGGGGVTTVPGTGTTLGAFTVNVTALPKASQIYFQGYATNSSGTTYSGVMSFWSEPDTAAAPTVNNVIPGENYFDLTVNYVKPANADGVLVVVRQSYAPKAPPFDGTLYSANARIGSGSTTDPACSLYCEYVVADAAASGTVTVNGLKAGTNHYFAVYAYKGSGAGLSGINYVQTIAPTMKATASVPLAGRSHNELWVAAASPKDGVNWGTETSTDCANCHGSHHTSQLLPTGVDMYDKCYTCHKDGGAADDNTPDAKINMALHLSDGSVDCGTCHSMHSFRTEELFSEDNQGNKGFNLSFVRSNMAKYFNTGNGFATNALEPTVFQNRPTDFANAAADAPYNAVCQTCHTDVARTPHHQQVATDEHQTGMDCMICHTHRNASGKMDAFAPGGHDATHFPWDGTTQTSCGTVGCHDFAANPDVVGDVHNGACLVCHSSASGGDGTAKVGDATFGIDGNATLGSTATPHTDNCLVCHPAATYDRSTVHHNSKNGYATAGNCIQCHAGSNYPGDHSARVSLAANCADCHNGTQGIAGGIPVDPDDATVAERKVHDACTTCHNTDGDATLMPPYGAAQAMPGSGTPSNNGGGSCEACHTATFGGYHATVGHATTVNSYVNCSSCHAGTEGTAGGIPTDAGNPKVHDACNQCHDVDGRLKGSAATHNGGTNGGSDAVNNCATCHGEYFNSHSHSHTGTVIVNTGSASNTVNCIGCHTTATAGTGPFTASVHNASGCATCHTAVTGALKGSAATANINGIVADSAYECRECHAAYFTGHTVHTATAGHDVAFNATTDKTVDGAACNTCHGVLTSWSDISTLHTACTKCHDYNGTNGTYNNTPAADVTAAITSGVGNTCVTCHTDKDGPATHGAIDHVAQGKATFVAQCAGCHDQGGAGDDAKMMAIHNASGKGCGTCHVSTSGGGPLVDKSGGGTYASQAKNYEATNPAGGSCVICHDAYGSNFQTGHWAEDHRNAANTADMVASTASCTANCHTATTAATIISTTHKNTCTLCHTNTTTDGRLKAGVSNGTAANHVIDTASTCINCHGGAYSYDSNFETAHDVKDHTGMAALASCTTNCHSAATIANNIAVTHKNNCVNCHSNTTTDGRLVNGAANAGSYGGTAQNRGDATLGAGDCAKCHGATGSFNYDSQFQTAHIVEDHTGMAALASCTTNCHSSATIANNITLTHKNNCVNCHSNTTTDGRLVNGAANAASYGGTAQNRGDATLGAGDCAKCHGATGSFNYDSQFQTAHIVEDHTGMAALASCTTNCHSAATIANNITLTHKGTCVNCHSNTTTDGRLVNGAANAGSYGGTAQNRGDATLGTGDCAKCHGATGSFNYDSQFQTAHIVEDHTGMAALASCTTNCHSSATIANNITLTHKNNCVNCHSNTTTDGRLVNGAANAASYGGTAQNRGDATLGAGDCAKCHGATGSFNYDSQFQTAHIVEDHTGMAALASCTTNCHSAATIANNITLTHKGTCVNCHSNTTTDGRLVNGAANAGSYGGTAQNRGDATLGTGDCAKCHGATGSFNYDSQFQTAHIVEDHTGMTALASCTTNCHNASTIANNITSTHKNNCVNCHSNTTTDGRLVNGAANAASYGGTAQNRGDATLGTGDCAKCHGATGSFNYDSQFATAHIVEDHTGITYTATVDTGIQSNDCQDCHNQTTAATIISTTHKNVCADCHSNTTTDGRLIAGNTAGSYSGTTSVGDATLHTPLGATSGCITCHATAYFSNTNTPKHTNGTSNAGVHRVAIDGDTSGGQTCSTAGCHAGQSENWTNILARHDLSATDTDVCHVCHDSTRTTNTSTTGVQNEITTALGRTVITSCLECHADKSASHGNPHKSGDTKVQNTAACMTCHPETNGPVQDIHGNQCGLCHVAAGGGGPLIAYLETNWPTGGTCAQCHFAAATAAGHHGYLTNASGRTTGPGPQGLCINCHDADVGQTGTSRAAGNLDMPANLACNWCHLYAPSGYTLTSGKVNIYGLTWTPGSTPNVAMTKTARTTHAISTNVTTPISDYAACFACHGKTAYTGTAGTSTSIHPFHGLYGKNYASPNTADNGGNPRAAGDMINIFASPTITTTSAIHTGARHFGWKALNWLQPYVSPDGANNAVGGGKAWYGGNSGYKKIYDPDALKWTRKTATYVTTFNIPWDNFGAGTVAAPQNITVNTGSVNGNQAVPSTVPTVKLNLP